MKSVGVHPGQPEMQNLVRVEISALQSDWVALQAHGKSYRGWHKLSTFQWGLGSVATGLHYFPEISLGCTPVPRNICPFISVKYNLEKPMAQVSKEIKKLQGLVEIDLRNGQRGRIEKLLRTIHCVRTEEYQGF